MSLDQQWQLAVTWYTDRLTAGSGRPGPDEAKEIFRPAGIGW